MYVSVCMCVYTLSHVQATLNYELGLKCVEVF